ncbi:hypothetical protein [Priestia endophytica]|uniref:hypothetical protein n=1 Tax=Priestia endophytica TaxID=135735 RepID=UPI00228192C0|nr:hypothetical protein [Priestia endophytica]MCY8231704.1 hypothetical protein [Priestia endophytica]
MGERIGRILKLNINDNEINQMDSKYSLSVPNQDLYDFKGGGWINPNLSWLVNFKNMGEN